MTQPRSGDRFIAWGVSPHSGTGRHSAKPRSGDRFIAWGVSPRKIDAQYRRARNGRQTYSYCLSPLRGLLVFGMPFLGLTPQAKYLSRLRRWQVRTNSPSSSKSFSVSCQPNHLQYSISSSPSVGRNWIKTCGRDARTITASKRGLWCGRPARTSPMPASCRFEVQMLNFFRRLSRLKRSSRS
jgi:hypothetical protein